MLFSDPDLARALNENFVCAWINRQPAVVFPDGLYDGQSAQDLPPGTGDRNIAFIFAEPSGRVLNAVPGYLDRRQFESEMNIALRLRQADRELLAQAHSQQALLAPDSVASRAHEKLAKAGSVALSRITFDFFDR